MRVLIIKTAPLGDIISALPVLDYLHQAVPGIEIDWVVEESLAEVLEDNPLVASLHPVRTGEWRTLPKALATVKEISALKETLPRREYNFAFDLEGSFNSGLISRLSGAQDAIGFERGEVSEKGNLLFGMRRVPLRRQDNHLAQKCLRLVSVPFARDFGAMTLSSTVVTSVDDDLAAEALLATLSDGLVFLFDCSADCNTKLWTGPGWVELGRRLQDSYKDASILLSCGSDADRNFVAGIAKQIEGARVIDDQTLKGAAALLKKVDLVIGGDTDTVKLAAALGTPTVSFYRATDGRESGPRGEGQVVVQSPIHCTRCFRIHCDKDVQCRGTIKVEALLAGVQSLFGT